MITTPPQSLVGIYRCSDYNYAEIKKAIRQAGEDLLGGWESFIPSGSSILLKPNLLKASTPEQGVSPHPAVVRAVAEICMEAGAGKITIGDSPGFGSAEKIAERCGILEVARDLGIELKDFSETTTIAAQEGFFHKHFTVAKDVTEHDIIINLPKFKTHAMMGLTLSVKNLYGLFVGKQKVRWHLQSGSNHKHFARLLVELAYSIKPDLTILDAVMAMEGNGPGNGTPRKLGFISVSTDMLSLDVVAAEIAGVKQHKIPVLQVAEEMGFNTSLKNIEVKGSSIDSLKIHDLKLASNMNIDGPVLIRPLVWMLRKYMTTRPFVNKGLCEKCGICIEACPAGCISQASKEMPVKIESTHCICCFCCQELCPHGAIEAKDSVGVKLLKKLKLE